MTSNLRRVTGLWIRFQGNYKKEQLTLLIIILFILYIIFIFNFNQLLVNEYFNQNVNIYDDNKYNLNQKMIRIKHGYNNNISYDSGYKSLKTINVQKDILLQKLRTHDSSLYELSMILDMLLDLADQKFNIFDSDNFVLLINDLIQNNKYAKYEEIANVLINIKNYLMTKQFNFTRILQHAQYLQDLLNIIINNQSDVENIFTHLLKRPENQTTKNNSSLSKFSTIFKTSLDNPPNKTVGTGKAISFREFFLVSSRSPNFQFKYVINEPEFCSTLKNLSIINLVMSGLNEKGRRSKIRQLWGSRKWFNRTGYSVLFILGSSNNSSLNENIKEESFQYRDIIQLNFIDTYQNLTVKMLSLLHWTKNFCKNPTWVLKSDTDVSINPFTLRRYLDTYDIKTNQSRNELICKTKKKDLLSPCRLACNHVKWRIVWHQYPFNKYPPHCHGPGYIIPRKLIDPLLDIGDNSKLFPLEDVHYTGILPYLLKSSITRHNINHLFPWRPIKFNDIFINSDLMVLEMDNGIGEGTSSKYWELVLHNEGLL